MEAVQPQVLVDRVRAAGVLCIPRRCSAMNSSAPSLVNSEIAENLLLVRCAKGRHILISSCLWITLGTGNDFTIQAPRIMHEIRNPLVARLERRRELAQPRIPVENHLALGFLCVASIAIVQRQRRQVDRRGAEEQEVARAGGVHVGE